MIVRSIQTTAIVMFLIGSVHTQELLSTLPSCALSCINSYAVQQGCNLTDISCLCTHQLWPDISTCAHSICTTRDALASHRIAGQTCGVPLQNQSNKLVIVSILFASISAMFMALRVFFRSLKHWELWGWDDALIVLCFVTGLPITATDMLMVHYGFGQDVWELSPAQIDHALFWFFILEITYVSSTLLMKLSILAFYIRVFIDEHFRRRVFFVMGISLAFTLSFVAVGLNQCRPLPYLWSRWDDQRHGTCLNISGIIWSQAVLNILLDIGILALPIPILTSLQFSYSRKTKAQIAAMFGVGLLVTLISILRLRTLLVFAGTDNPTWDYLGAALWSTIEVHVGIVCTCLPAARAFTTRIVLPWLRLKTKLPWTETEATSTQHPSQMQVLPSMVTTVMEDSARHSGDTINKTDKEQSGDSEHAMYDCYRKEWI